MVRIEAGIGRQRFVAYDGRLEGRERLAAAFFNGRAEGEAY
jgi:hypothetical protein